MKYFLTVTFALMNILSGAYAFDDGDFQYWTTESIEVKINEDWKIGVAEEFRFGDDAAQFYYHHTDAGLTCFFNEYLEGSLNYRQVFQEKNNKWDSEHKPHVNGTVKVKWRGAGFRDRSRFEYKLQDNGDNSWCYRNKLTVDLPFKGVFDVQPYAADEVFYDFDKNKLNRNRAQAGFKMCFFKNLKGEIYYMYQTTLSNSWTECFIFGTSLKFVF